MSLTVEALVERFGLVPHPEGGFYSETFRSAQEVSITREGDEAESRRPASTAIFFLISSQNVSRLHRIKSDECWHFYLGSPMTVVELDEAACTCTLIELGNDDLLSGKQKLQYVVKAGVWFGCFPNAPSGDKSDSFSLVGCTVAPGFVFEDFELASKAYLATKFAGNQEALELIEKLTIGLP